MLGHQDNLRVLSGSFWFIAVLSLVGFAFATDAYSPIVLYLSLTLLGLVLYKPETITFFVSAFSINTFFSVVIAWSFYSQNGKPFALGGDDTHFYETVISLINGDSIRFGNYPAYLYLQSAGYYFTRLLGFTDDSFLVMAVMNAFGGATVIPAMYKMSKRYLNEKQSKAVGWLVLCFPVLIVYSAILLRDIWLVMTFSLVVTISLNEKIPQLFKILLVLILAGVSYFFRSVNGVFPLIFLFAYYIFSIKSLVIRYSIAIAIVVPILALFYNQIASAIELIQLKYELFASQGADSSSLGMRIAYSNNPILKIAYFFILLLNPVPPFHSFQPHDFLVGIGTIAWYLMAPGFVMGLIKALKDEKIKRFASAFLTVFLMGMYVLFLIRGSERHKLFLYPFFIFFFLYYLFTADRKGIYHVYGFYLIIIVLLILSYVGLKIIV